VRRLDVQARLAAAFSCRAFATVATFAQLFGMTTSSTMAMTIGIPTVRRIRVVSVIARGG
jgi:hypothetical protein